MSRGDWASTAALVVSSTSGSVAVSSMKRLDFEPVAYMCNDTIFILLSLYEITWVLQTCHCGVELGRELSYGRQLKSRKECQIETCKIEAS